RENTAISTMFIKAIDPQPGEWCGIMTGFAGGLDIQTAQYLEIWVNDYTVDPEERSGVLHIDIGRIDEDFHQPELNEFDDEKQVDWTEAFDNGFVGDDLGTYPQGGFGYDESKRIVPGINSRDGNLYHDSEDLNRNSRMDDRNEYYSLTLQLSDTAIIDVQRDFPKDTYGDYWNDATKTGGTYQINRKKSWRMYRLDLSKVETPSGIPPRLDAIQHMRMWVEDISEIEARVEENNAIDNMIEIGEVKFVGSRWEFNYIRDLEDETRIISTPDMKVRVGTVNNKDNPSLYYSPYPVDVEDGLENREQSLLIEVEEFEKDRSFRLMKRFIGNGEDFQQYREIEFFVRGDNELTSHNGDLVDFYLQFAYDSLNFYEIAVPLTPENAGGWNDVRILLSDLTDMKLDAVKGEDVETVISDVLDPSKKYTATLRGNPSLFRVKYLFAGLRNRSGVMIPRGQVWFNDIVLGNVRKDVDHAERINVSASFGNVLSVSGAWTHTGPEFRSLGRKAGS
ncbi:MAG TPA: hypothetical protein VLA34_12170, partial [Candidatus Krumholzibacterium sp.]|nr:hypothetical protein [Candidatus Krumholzibacterium sp.]